MKPLQEKVDIFMNFFFAAFGEEPTREGLRETPKRWLRAWAEMCGGYDVKAEDVLAKTFSSQCDGIVVCRDIEFYSTCEHHLLPFFGRVHIGYIPNGKVVGVSKLVRVVEALGKRFQIQEELTEQIATAINTTLCPKGVMVVVEAQHLCMKARGVRNHSSVMTTSVVRGLFKTESDARQECLQLMKGITSEH